MPDNFYILDPQCSRKVLLHGLGHTEVGISKPTDQLLIPVEEIVQTVMAYSSTPYVEMAPEKNGGHIKSAQMTHSKCLR